MLLTHQLFFNSETKLALYQQADLWNLFCPMESPDLWPV